MIAPLNLLLAIGPEPPFALSREFRGMGFKEIFDLSVHQKLVKQKAPFGRPGDPDHVFAASGATAAKHQEAGLYLTGNGVHGGYFTAMATPGIVQKPDPDIFGIRFPDLFGAGCKSAWHF